MGAVEDVLNMLQNVVAPSLKSLAAGMSGLEGTMETSERHTGERIKDLRADVSAGLEAMRSEKEAKLGSIRDGRLSQELRAQIRAIRAPVEPGPQEAGPHPRCQAVGR